MFLRTNTPKAFESIAGPSSRLKIMPVWWKSHALISKFIKVIYIKKNSTIYHGLTVPRIIGSIASIKK